MRIAGVMENTGIPKDHVFPDGGTA